MHPDEELREELIVVRAQMGDSRAFESLIRANHPKLLYYIGKMLLRKDLAEDVAQEVWMTAWRKLRHLRASQAFKVWLYRIAHAETVRIIRQESRYVELSVPFDLMETDQDSGEDFTDEEIRMVNIALERLNPTLREAITLRFIEGMSYEEIAQITEVPIGTVRSRLHYAKQTLRREMEEIRNGKE